MAPMPMPMQNKLIAPMYDPVPEQAEATVTTDGCDLRLSRIGESGDSE